MPGMFSVRRLAEAGKRIYTCLMQGAEEYLKMGVVDTYAFGPILVRTERNEKEAAMLRRLSSEHRCLRRRCFPLGEGRDASGRMDEIRSCAGCSYRRSSTGMTSRGAGTVIRCAPSNTSPVSTLRQRPSGRYTLRVRAPYAITGATR